MAEGLEVDLTNFVHWPAELSVRNLPAEHKAGRGGISTRSSGTAGTGRWRPLPSI